MQFQTVKNGYDKVQVESQISSMKKELSTWKERALAAEADYIKLKERENEIKRSGENIALALTAAIDKAKQIEASSRNVYKLKIQQISILYDRWEMLLQEILQKYPKLEDSHNIKNMLNDFKITIENVVSQNFEQTVDQNENNNNDTMRVLLSKMSKSKKGEDNKRKFVKIERNNLPESLINGKSELNNLEEKAVMIKPITNLTLGKNDTYETLADKFLKEDIAETPQYTNFMSKRLEVDEYPYPNESGFNLKEAVNPTEDLDEIMKSFDFFTDNENA